MFNFHHLNNWQKFYIFNGENFPIYGSFFCHSYQEVEEEGNHIPQEVGGKEVGGQVVWGEVVDYQEGHLSAGWEEGAGHCHGD